MDYTKYFEANKRLWDHKTPIHLQSEFYDHAAFIQGMNSLKKIELEDLGNINGKKVIHLQCHFGQDTMSMARMGAKMTGIDLSESSIAEARKTNEKLGLDCKFIEGNVYDVLELVDDTYDMVFTSYGAICWLPDLKMWAEQVSGLLKPGGMLHMVEFHPYLYTFDWDSKKPSYHYFNKGVYHEVEQGTYANKDAKIGLDEYFWIHPISDVLNSLIGQNMQIQEFKEYDYSPYACFENLVKRGPEEFVFDIGISCPHVFSLKAEKLT